MRKFWPIALCSARNRTPYSYISTFCLPTDYFQTIAQIANNAGYFGLHWTFFWNRFFVFFLKTILLFFLIIAYLKP